MDKNFLGKQFESYRAEIDQINIQLLRLFNQRAVLVLEIGKLKQQLNLPYRDLLREEEILQHLQQENKGPFSKEDIQQLFQLLFDISLTLQQNQKNKTN